MKRKFKIFSIFLCLMFFMPMNIIAKDFDANKIGSISIELIDREDNTPIDGVEFSLYHVAYVQVDNKGDFVYQYTNSFEGFEIEFDDPTLLESLERFIDNHSISYLKLKTDTQGKLKFDNLPLGLYFIKQTNTVEGYAPCANFLINVPMITENGYLYDVNATPKVEITKLVDITVKKVWNTDESTKISKNVTIELHKDNELIDFIILHEENNWEYTFHNMPLSDAYSIVEVDVPKGFIATYDQKGFVFTVTNTSSLIHTGQVVWPIPVLIALGTSLIILGSIILIRAREQDA